MYKFSQDLFATGDAPFSFKVSSCSDASELTSCIEFGGGRVDETAGPCTITLLDPGCGASVVTPDQDVFSSLFIWKCCSLNSLLSLKDFRLNSDSCFTTEFDPNDILIGKMSWEDAKALFKKKPIIRPLRKFQSPKDSVIINGSVPVISIELVNGICDSRRNGIPHPSLQAATKKNKRTRNDYTQEERENMVCRLVEAQAFSEYSRDQLWIKMEKLFPRHTWQSYKQHFKKKVFPNIESYDLPVDVIARIKDGYNKPKSNYEQMNGSRSSSDDLSSPKEQRKRLKPRRYPARIEDKSIDKPSSSNRNRGSKSNCDATEIRDKKEIETLEIDEVPEVSKSCPIDAVSGANVACKKSSEVVDSSDTDFEFVDQLSDDKSSGKSFPIKRKRKERKYNLRRNQKVALSDSLTSEVELTVKEPPLRNNYDELKRKTKVTGTESHSAQTSKNGGAGADNATSSSTSRSRKRSHRVFKQSDNSESPDPLLNDGNLNSQITPGNRSRKDASIIICPNPVGNSVSVESSLQVEVDNLSTHSSLTGFDGTEFPRSLVEALMEESERRNSVARTTGCPDRKEKAVQWDSEEAPVSDSGMQTEQVTILPLPPGWEYPMTFAAAFEMLEAANMLNLHEDLELAEAAEDSPVEEESVPVLDENTEGPDSETTERVTASPSHSDSSVVTSTLSIQAKTESNEVPDIFYADSIQIEEAPTIDVETSSQTIPSPLSDDSPRSAIVAVLVSSTPYHPHSNELQELAEATSNVSETSVQSLKETCEIADLPSSFGSIPTIAAPSPSKRTIKKEISSPVSSCRETRSSVKPKVISTRSRTSKSRKLLPL